MSRFFRQAGDSDSDTESSEDELMSSDEEAPAAKPAAKPAMSRFLKGAASDSSSSSDSDSDSDEDDDSDAPKKGKGRAVEDEDEVVVLARQGAKGDLLAADGDVPGGDAQLGVVVDDPGPDLLGAVAEDLGDLVVLGRRDGDGVGLDDPGLLVGDVED